MCKICGNTQGNKSYIAREMMFGFKDEFEYHECSECGCLQIGKVPDNLSKYYSENYYSYQKNETLTDKSMKSFVIHQVSRHLFYRKNIIGALVFKFYRMPMYCKWLIRANVHIGDEILDVGCGAGHLLLKLRRGGFSALVGVDPYIGNDILYENGVKIYKKEIYEITHKFDFIILNHSFEHMDKPLRVFRELYRLLKPGRYLLIRIPVASSYCWKKYGVNWVQLDAPRHLFLHTIKSIQILAGQVGLKVADVIFDSTDFQFWGSEQYCKDIPFNDKKSYAQNRKESIFSKAQIRSFKAKAIELNKNNNGDSACFYLYKT